MEGLPTVCPLSNTVARRRSFVREPLRSELERNVSRIGSTRGVMSSGGIAAM